jgi:hypothetical protein
MPMPEYEMRNYVRKTPARDLSCEAAAGQDGPKTEFLEIFHFSIDMY